MCVLQATVLKTASMLAWTVGFESYFCQKTTENRKHKHTYTHKNQKLCPRGSGPILVRNCPRTSTGLRTTICRLISIAWTVIGSWHLRNVAVGENFKGKARRLSLRHKSHLACVVLCLTQNWYLKKSKLKFRYITWKHGFMAPPGHHQALGDAYSLVHTPLSRAHQAPSLLY